VRGLHRRRPSSSLGLQGRAPRSRRQAASGKRLTHPTEGWVPDSRVRAGEAQASWAVTPVRGHAAPEGDGGLNPRRVRSTNRTCPHAQIFFGGAESFELFSLNQRIQTSPAAPRTGGSSPRSSQEGGSFARKKNRTKWRKPTTHPGIPLGRAANMFGAFFDRRQRSEDSCAQSAELFLSNLAASGSQKLSRNSGWGGSVAGLLQGM
jgi:hypothetical protein